MDNHIFGKKGEDEAVQYLIKNNYEIIDRNFFCNRGEIDIIAKDREEIVFIEVKTRKSVKYGTPAEAVDTNKQKHIYNVAEYYLYKNRLEKEYVRIDVIEIYYNNNQYKINHIKKAID